MYSTQLLLLLGSVAICKVNSNSIVWMPILVKYKLRAHCIHQSTKSLVKVKNNTSAEPRYEFDVNIHYSSCWIWICYSLPSQMNTNHIWKLEAPNSTGTALLCMVMAMLVMMAMRLTHGYFSQYVEATKNKTTSWPNLWKIGKSILAIRQASSEVLFLTNTKSF